MRLYIYSYERLAFVEMKWARSTAVVAGFLIVAMIASLGSLTLAQTDPEGAASRSAVSWMSENDIIRAQARDLNTRLIRIERKTEHLEALFQILGRVHVNERRFSRTISASDSAHVQASPDRPIRAAIQELTAQDHDCP